ncbi:MAG TPA: Sec-independent protein translocase protein TatB [Bacteroidales bacterium]|nr:Sec-independent protein translocase protein TatB [Bacteroidales bacterium]
MLLFFDLGTGEILLILLVLFIVVGPRQLPEVARTVGKAINEMKRASTGFRNEIQKEANRLERESGINEIRKTLEDVKVTEVYQDQSVAAVELQSDTSGDTIGAIPFGTDQANDTDQSEHNANKSQV